MGVKVKNPTSAQIEELRQRFNTQYANSPPAAPFHHVDLARIRNENLWLQRFLEMHDLDMDTAFTKLWETCVWRQSYGANDLHHSQLNQEYLNQGCAFVHNQDVDGKPLLIFRVRLHNKSKNLDELIRIVVYWVERVQRENHLTQLTIFFDMAGTGLATMDLDFVKRIVETFKLYYPNALNYIIVYELAWVLNAAFKVIKALLPPKAVEILKMISKKDVTQYVTKDNCLTSWGGTDDYEYSFAPPSESKQAAPKIVAANAGDAEQPPQDYDKKVHFAEMVLHDTSIKELHTPSDGEGMLQLEPSENVNFCPHTGDAKLTLKNISQQPIVYKIQTTSPEKFRVRPRCGVIPAQCAVEVSICLKSDHQLSPDGKDKFLVMAAVAPSADCGSQEVADIWKEKGTNDADVENYRLVCRHLGKSKEGMDVVQSGGSQPGSKFGPQELQEQAREMSAQLRHTRNLQYVTLALIVLLFAGFGFLLFERIHFASGDLQGSAAGACQQTAPYKCAKHK
ncbi:motile sperm domain-containing protein 2 isoform X1 [Drosophila albomicans]|uniref:Motile sperm domain-containing protein 2 isoform X1 n=1 Tax=Drosophila albomicans TaxID=7291 RepID=A0A6P8Z4S7_DROAB|nr:motile sperm domain-containing protein 2 isoform X1 [Drosophila albomicans]